MRRILAIVAAALCVISLSVISCSDSGTGATEIDGIAGTVTYLDGITPVAGATVVATTDTKATYTTTSGNDGSFGFPNAADGTYTVTADKGSFHAEGTVTVSGGKSGGAITLKLDIAASKIGVVPGSYDSIEDILTDLGYSYTTLSDSDLADSSSLDPLELLFLNCGSDTSWASDTTVQDNLRDYVNGGGYLYASDWDYEYVEETWPGAIDFYEPDPYIGDMQTITADVVDGGLAGYLGKDTAQILFDLPDWIVIDDVAGSTTVLVEGDFTTIDGPLTDRPIMVSFTRGGGVVGYTCFHNEANATNDAITILLYFISLTPPT
ncbi:MAG: hypothetical protein GY771_06435 [bacterium]|nr:hypothetical protein [bacterium]